LVKRKEITKVDQNGQRIMPKKKMEIANTRRKYLILTGPGG
jgi:hypothetical protein